jgi:AmmeMemoRadiSam system protein B/AmmeMemoRadiSam system protein A
VNITRILAAAVIVLLVPHSGPAAEQKRSTMNQIARKPAFAGQFYTGNPTALRNEIEEYLENADMQPIEGTIIALVSPHAGYMYSGQVAAYGYRLIRDKAYETVVVISPSHADYFDFNSVFPGKSYLTPLGEIPIDHEMVDEITARNDLVRADLRGHISGALRNSEHSLEVQLPFLQVALGEFKLVPIVMGAQSSACIEALGNALGEALQGRKVLIVASTDLSHFHGDASAKRLDNVFMDKLRAFDSAELTKALNRKDTEACGGGPTAAAIIASRKLGAERCVVRHYANSGDVTGDTTRVVGYVSAVMLVGTENRRENNPSGGNPSFEEKGNDSSSGRSDSTVTGLAGSDKIYLLKLARRVIETECAGEKIETERPSSPVLLERRGGFVTLKKKGQLRGCIGYIEAVKPLITTVEEMAKSAAFNDMRFPPVTAAEVPDIDIEISVLSPITEINDPSAIEVGKHGIIITRGPHRGLLLPQVATEWGWDRLKFLEQTCNKAGLPIDAWKQPGTKIEIFSAEIFSEIEMGLR